MNQDEMVKQLIAFCNVNSGSYHLDGLHAMHDLLIKEFEPIADQINSIPLPEVSSISMKGDTFPQPRGNALLIRKRPDLKRRVFLCGHMDTVYDKGHSFQHTRFIDSNTLNGPGVTDMKGGLVILLNALKAFEQEEESLLLGWDVWISPDEEIGSSASSGLMCEMAQGGEAALVFEPSMTPSGTLAKNRKGSIKLTIVSKGVAAHAGRDFNAGRNAICFLASVISAIDELNGQRDGVTLNVGQIEGGTALNVVPDTAIAKVDIRITLPEDELWIREQLQHIETTHRKEGHSVSFHSAYDRPPKRVNEGTELLFSRLSGIAQSLNIHLEWMDSGGCCDGNNLSQLGIPVIDTMGARGGKIHTKDEYILLDSLIERATLTKLLLVDLAKNS